MRLNNFLSRITYKEDMIEVIASSTINPSYQHRIIETLKVNRKNTYD